MRRSGGGAGVGIAEAAEPSIELLGGLDLHRRQRGCRDLLRRIRARALLGIRVVGGFDVLGDGEFGEWEAL